MKAMFPWLKEAPAQALQQALLDLDKAYVSFFTGAGYPNFKRREDGQSFRYPQGEQLEVVGNHVFLPKVGWVKFRRSRNPPAKILSATVSYDRDHWYISLAGAAPDRKTGHVFTQPSLALDLGVKHHLTDQDNHVYQLPTMTEAERAHLHILQRLVSKKPVGSKNRAKAQAKYRKAHRKILNRMNDARHKLTTSLAKNHGWVGVEDLRVKNMTASAKGTVESPGKHVRQKAGLNRAMLEIGFGEIRRQLTYKCERYGGKCIAVNPRGTSQTCPECQHTAKANRLSRDWFQCEQCSFRAPADQVGAINIHARAAGQVATACRAVLPRTHKTRHRFRKRGQVEVRTMTAMTQEPVRPAMAAPSGP
jgi:putative transposase